MAQEQQTAKKQLSKIVNVDLSISRIRHRLDDDAVNHDVDHAIDELKNALAEVAKGNTPDVNGLSDITQKMLTEAYDVYEQKKAKDTQRRAELAAGDAKDKAKLKKMTPFPARTDSWDEKLELVSELKRRFSGGSIVVMAAGLNYVLEQVAELTMRNTRKAGRSIIQVKQAVGEGFEELSTYPLLKGLPCVEHALDALDAEEDDEEEEVEGPTFDFYMESICKKVRTRLMAEDEDFKHIRLSSTVKDFGTRICIDLVNRMAPLVDLYCKTKTPVMKTVKESVINFVFELLLIDGGVDPAGFKAYVEERLGLYNTHKEEEKAKRAAQA